MGLWGRHKRRWKKVFGSDSSHGGVPPAATPPFITANDEVYSTDAPGQIDVPNFQANTIEGQRTAIKCVRMLGARGPLTVNWHTEDVGGATPGVDYVEASGTLTWDDLDVSPKMIEVETIENLGSDGLRMFRVHIIGAPGTRVVGGLVQVPIIDNDDPSVGPSVFRFAQLSAKVVENGGTITLKVNRSGSKQGAVGVTYNTANGTALAGTHYTTASGTLSWADGEGGEKSFAVPIINVGGAGGNKTFTATLTLPTGVSAIDTPYATVSVEIIDDESFTVTPGTVGFTVGNVSSSEASGTLSVPVYRSGGATGSVSVGYAASGVTAVEREHFQPASGTLTWADGDYSVKYIDLTIINNSEVKQSVSLTLTLSGLTGGANQGIMTCAVTILEDDRYTDFIAGAMSCHEEAIAPTDELIACEASVLVRQLGLVVGTDVGPPRPSETNRGATDGWTGAGTSNNFGMASTPGGKNTLQSV